MQSVPPVLPQRKASSKKRRRIIIFSVIGAVLVALALAAIFKKKEPLITVQTVKVARRNIAETVVANGKIQPVVQVHISPEVSGEIIDLPVKEGQLVKKGELILKIKPDLYVAGVNQANASYESSLSAKIQSEATLEKTEADFQRNKTLFDDKLLSESDFVGFKTALDIARAQVESALDQVAMSKAAVASAQDALDKTTIVSPLDGTVSKLNSQLGERVLGTAQNAGTEIMTIADLNTMEARVDVGETDVILIAPGQNVHLEVDAFKDRKFAGVVTDIANSSEGLDSPSSAAAAASSSSSQGGATKFEVRIRIKDNEFFRPGMSVSAEIETRYRTNALAVPIASVTTRVPKGKLKPADNLQKTNSIARAGTETNSTPNKKSDSQKLMDVVFVVEGDHVKTVPVKIGISDDNYWEITDGLQEGQEIVSGGYRAISCDLDDGKKITKGPAGAETEKKNL